MRCQPDQPISIRLFNSTSYRRFLSDSERSGVKIPGIFRPFLITSNILWRRFTTMNQNDDQRTPNSRCQGKTSWSDCTCSYCLDELMGKGIGRSVSWIQQRDVQTVGTSPYLFGQGLNHCSMYTNPYYIGVLLAHPRFMTAADHTSDMEHLCITDSDDLSKRPTHNLWTGFLNFIAKSTLEIMMVVHRSSDSPTSFGEKDIMDLLNEVHARHELSFSWTGENQTLSIFEGL